jgi:hypothetical protein
MDLMQEGATIAEATVLNAQMANVILALPRISTML